MKELDIEDIDINNESKEIDLNDNIDEERGPS